MKHPRTILGLTLLGLMIAMTVAFAAESLFKTATLVQDAADGKAKSLELTGSIASPLYLGVSMYPATYTSALEEGEHQIVELKKGSFSQNFTVKSRMNGGTWEAAIWSKKVPASQCTISDCYFCKHFGYHLDGQVTYLTGTLSFLTR